MTKMLDDWKMGKKLNLYHLKSRIKLKIEEYF